MAEKSLWSYLRKGMRGKWSHATRHEDSVSIGVADVSYYHRGNSWVELKEVKHLPKRPSTGISLGQWHNNGGAQRYFLTKRMGWLFIRVNNPVRTYLLFEWTNLPPWEKEKRWTWDEMKSNAYYIWTNRIDFETLDEFLGDPE
ncbi:MAG: hypothetical protein JRD93_17565 [Deltaproteobacteria bacterium]|nr:hypothetical protein [Deltaproteobacteria bacterium]